MAPADHAPNTEPDRVFVLLEHRWDGVHWDFMLDVGGSLRTWALEAFPAPGRVIACRSLPDHRPAYLDYEGPVSGGRGRVRRADRGVYRVVEWADERIRVRIEGDQVTGEAWLLREAGDRWVFRLLGKVD